MASDSTTYISVPFAELLSTNSRFCSPQTLHFGVKRTENLVQLSSGVNKWTKGVATGRRF